MVRWMFVTGALPVLLACSAPQDTGTQSAEASGENVAAALQRQLAPGTAATQFSDDETRGEASREFSYSWPAQAGAIPGFAAMLTQIRGEALAAQKREWEQSVAEFGPDRANAGCITCINRTYSADWKVAADTPRFLILRADRYAYTGGAHGNLYFEALMWDRQANDGEGAAMRPIALFMDDNTLQTIAYGDYCQALLEARAERLEINTGGMSKFENCPGIGDLVTLPTSSDGASLDRIEFLAAPYVAGSFAEGPYEFAIPMTAALLDAVRPKYRDAFAAGD